jgi:hypothetical protein
MKLNQKLIVAAITISLFLGFTGMARMRANDILRIAEKSSVEIQIAQNDFSTENDSDILYFGVPEERSPYGFIKTDSKIVSYCKELISYLRNYQEKKFNFKEISVNVAERFQGIVDEKKLIGECGPNSITEERKNRIGKIGGKFSETFFETGAKLLLKNEYLQEFFDEKIPLKNEKIAVIDKTTTKEIIKSIFPSSTIQIFNDRWEAFEALEKDPEIAAYATDEVILKGLWEENKEITKNSYSIVPRFRPLSYEEAGMVVYKNEDLLESINHWINSKEGQAARAELENLVKPNWLDQIFIAYERKSINYKPLLILILIWILVMFSHPLFLYLLIKIIPLKIAKIVLEKIQEIQNSNQKPVMIIANIIFNKIFYTTVELADEKLSTINIKNCDSDRGENSSMSNIQNNDFSGANIGGNVVGRDNTGDVINNNAQQSNLAEAAAEIQKLLKQLSQTYPTNTEEEQKTVANEVIKRIKSDPKSMQRILSALKAGGTSALGQFLNHPAATFIIEALKDWQETKRD